MFIKIKINRLCMHEENDLHFYYLKNILEKIINLHKKFLS
jgi:hypothetical protein